MRPDRTDRFEETIDVANKKLATTIQKLDSVIEENKLLKLEIEKTRDEIEKTRDEIPKVVLDFFELNSSVRDVKGQLEK